MVVSGDPISQLAEVNLSLISNLWIKQLVFKTAGMMALSHAHSFDHQTLLATGRLRVYVDDAHVRDFTAPQIIIVRAGQHHCFVALEDNTAAYCIHAVRIGERVDDIADPSQEVLLETAQPI